METTIPKNDQLAQEAMQWVEHFIQPLENKAFAVELWNGMRWEPSDRPAQVTLVIREPGVLRTLFLSGGTQALAELYMSGRADVVGDFEALIPLIDHLIALKPTIGEWFSLARYALKLPRVTTAPPTAETSQGSYQPAVLSGDVKGRQRVKDAIKYHYDLPSKFWQLWLDPYMQYTCAYFHSPEDDLPTAQLQKLEHICQKLRLQSGDRFLDMGCGWGGLIIYAAKHYNVRATGVTLSRLQAEHAQNWIKQEGLEDVCQVEFCDFRDAKKFGTFDKISGVGITEHLTSALINEYFQAAWNCLNPGGILFNQASGCSIRQPLRKESHSFITEYIFPNTEILLIGDLLRAAENAGFEVRDLENLREHYELTLRHWKQRFEDNADGVSEFFDDSAYRAYQMYFTGCIYDFKIGRNNLYQTLFVKPSENKSGMPLTRQYLYSS